MEFIEISKKNVERGKKKEELAVFSKRWLSVRYAIIEKHSLEKACAEKIYLLSHQHWKFLELMKLLEKK